MNSLIIGPPGSGKIGFVLKNKIIDGFKNNEPMIIFNRNNEVYDLVKDNIPITKKVFNFSVDDCNYYNFFEKYKNDKAMLGKIVNLISNELYKSSTYHESRQAISLSCLIKLLNFNNKEINLKNLLNIINDKNNIKNLCLRLFSSKDVNIEDVEVAESLYDFFIDYDLWDSIKLYNWLLSLNKMKCFDSSFSPFNIKDFLNKDTVLFIDLSVGLSEFNIIYKIIFLYLINECFVNLIPTYIYMDESNVIFNNSLTLKPLLLPMRFVNTTCCFHSFEQIELLVGAVDTEAFLNNFVENYISTHTRPNKYLPNYIPLNEIKKIKSLNTFIYKDFLTKKSSYKVLKFK